jgi:hypothetical protein
VSEFHLDELWGVHETVLEILKLLNRTDEEEDVPGLEVHEIARKLHDRWGMPPNDPSISIAMGLLIQHALARRELEPRYAWDRGRILGERYCITPDGKSYLVRGIEATGRIR